MFNLKATVNGNPFGNGLTKFADKKVVLFKKVLRSSADQIKKEVAGETKGKLKNSFRTKQDNGGFTQIVYSTKFYMHFTNNDTKQHIIKPKKAKFLAWGGYAGKFEFKTLRGKNAGKWTNKKVYKNFKGQLTLNRADATHQNFALKVDHPAARGAHYMEKTLENNRGVILQALKNALDS